MIALVAGAAALIHALYTDVHARHEQLVSQGVSPHYLVCRMADADTDAATKARQFLNEKSLTPDDRKAVENEALYWEGEAAKAARECAS